MIDIHATPDTPSRALHSRKQTAPIIGFSVRKLDDLTKRRVIPCLRIDGAVRYAIPDVLAALKRFEQEAIH